MVKISFAQVIFMTMEFVCAEFNLTVLHTNDVHSRVEELNTNGGRCSDNEKLAGGCYGGVARRHTMVKKVRESSPNTILLDGGDQFQGTTWFGVYKGLEAVTFMNLDRYDAMALGNHEFDNGVEGVIPFILNATFSILSANMNVSKVSNWPKNSLFAKSKVFQRSGVKVGVIGYTTPETSWLSRPGPNISFHDIISSVQAEAIRLKDEGVHIIIALGHAGFETDKRLATEVNDLDLVVGGHTNTFLYTGKPPSVESVEGPYPYVITRSDGSKVLVVQAFTFGKYLGKLDINFNKEGKTSSWSGNPILLNSSIPEDPLVKAMIVNLSAPILKERMVNIGTTLVYLNGAKPLCRVRDCNLGNLLADAVLKLSQEGHEGLTSDLPVASIWNAGSLRSSISKEKNESITLEDLYTILPFGNTADIAHIPGAVLRKAFEWSVSGVNEYAGRYLQVSGIRMRYNPRNPVGRRITELMILCNQCSPSKYEHVENKKVYKIVASNYILEGGDGFDMLKSVTKQSGEDVVGFMRAYIKKMSPISIQADGRTMAQDMSHSPATSLKSSLVVFVLNVFVVHCCNF